eukprot:1060121-Prymnesium_polylepis.1
MTRNGVHGIGRFRSVRVFRGPGRCTHHQAHAQVEHLSERGQRLVLSEFDAFIDRKIERVHVAIVTEAGNKASLLQSCQGVEAFAPAIVAVVPAGDIPI